MILELGATAREALFDGDYPVWVAEAFAASGIGTSGFALFILFAGAIGLMNWSEGFRVPAVWVALMSPLVAATLPVPVVMRLFGVITTAVASLFIGLWIYFGRQ
jgi:hypothetical protein